MPADTSAGARSIENIIPILRVEDLSASRRYYEQVLAFETEWSAADFAGLSRDGWRLYLSQGSQGHPGTWLWIGVEDIDQMYADCRARGARIVTEMTSNPWAREFHVADPDGHILRFGGAPDQETT